MVDIIKTSSRLPDFVMGDLSAQLAAVRLGARVIRELYARYGGEAVGNAMLAAFEEDETRSLSGLASLEKGRFPISTEQDDGVVWSVTI